MHFYLLHFLTQGAIIKSSRGEHRKEEVAIMKNPMRKIMFEINEENLYLFIYCFEVEVSYFIEEMKVKKPNAHYVSTLPIDSSFSNIINCKKHKFYFKEL